MPESLLIKLQARPATLLKKDTLALVLFREFCKISKNTFFIEHKTRCFCSSIAAPLAQNVESKQSPRWPAHNVKLIFGQTKKKYQPNENLSF